MESGSINEKNQIRHTSGTYVALRDALFAVKGEQRIVVSSLVSSYVGGLDTWLKAAYSEFRWGIVHCDLSEIETVGELIATVLEAYDEEPEDEFSDHRINRESILLFKEALTEILADDNRGCILTLKKIIDAVYFPEHVKWGAYYWAAKAAFQEGDLKSAHGWIEEAQTRADKLDLFAQASTLSLVAELTFFQNGDLERCIEQFTQALTYYEAINYKRGIAGILLRLARLMFRNGREEEGLRAAFLSQKTDLEWEAPSILLSELALMKAQLDEAEAILQPFLTSNTINPDVIRQQRLVVDVRSGRVPLGVVNEYIWQKYRPANLDNTQELNELWQIHNGFDVMRELLAWNLTKIGRLKEARQHFEALSKQERDPQIKGFALRGLQVIERKIARNETLDGLEDETDSQRAQSENANFAINNEVVNANVDRAAFSGNLQLFSIPDLLEFLKSSRRTGTLIVTTQEGVGVVELQDGMMIWAFSPGCKKLETLLLDDPEIASEELKFMLGNWQATEYANEDVYNLQESGLVALEKLQLLLREQIKSALLDMVSWESGAFAFKPLKPGQENKLHLHPVCIIDTQEVILDVLRMFDEQNQ